MERGGERRQFRDIKVWEWAKEKLTKEELNSKLLLARDDRERTAWQVAAMMFNTESLVEIWKWAKVDLTPENLKNEFLLAKDNRKKTAWQVAAEWGKSESLEKIREWAKG
jgi:hypothetical protein